MKNYISVNSKIMKNNLKKIEDAVLAITFSCNSRCRMCSIWKRKDHEFADKNIYKNLPKNIQNINLTGGEPFLHPEIKEIIEILNEKSPKASIIISTNGIATDLAIKKAKEIIKVKPDIGVAVSIDGIGKAHDEIRGIPGAFDQAKKTLAKLRKIGIKNLKISFTLGNYNASELSKVYNLAKQFNAEFSLTLVHSGENYFGSQEKVSENINVKNALDWLIHEELQTWNVKKWLRAYYTFGTKYFIENGKRLLPDYSGNKSIFIDPQGNIFPSDISDFPMGKIDREGFAVEKIPERKDLISSWMICTARQSIKKHWIKALTWIIINKFFKMKRNNPSQNDALRRHYEIEKRYSDLIKKSPKNSAERKELFKKGYEEIMKIFEEYNPGGAYTQYGNTTQKLSESLLSKGGRVLDYGCGEGSLLEYLDKKGFEVYGFDVSESNVQKTREKISESAKNRIMHGDIWDFSEGLKEKFDLIAMDNVIEHIPEDEIGDIVKKCREMLSENGTLLVLTPHKLSGPHDISKFFVPLGSEAECFHLKEYGVTDTVSILKKNGFSDVRNFFVSPRLLSKLRIKLKPSNFSTKKALFLEKIVLNSKLRNLFKINRLLSRFLCLFLFPTVIIAKK